ncbi:hypothetical protein EEB12_28655 [Rhodococcus sp. WS1]|uniref:DUF6924 domain-containing protein n=1 Tax=unclassified Rhodococcus (in: high G+C Gram-positive bacteria) TaxID=192944 RepID=UPI0011411A4D|nr:MULTISPECIES: hypothetical protein [unclassified Rhodococcus (in: high G+C Gram-positive bacteria)]ROZ52822.1 hypothetical protein EEB12_28655 [Rhodococcus sp. WS1]TQC34346.1 hypothetical protein EEB16_29630 [Rhodococcus sp. WS7]
MSRQLPEISEYGGTVWRTDFSDDRAWDLLKSKCSAESEEGFFADLNYVSDPELAGLTVPELVELATEMPPYFIFLADDVTFSHADSPLLAVDLSDEPGRTVRVVPSQMAAIENNLSLANMDFAEFADTADEQDDKIFRGF